MNDILKTKRRYNRNAHFYDFMEWPVERLLFGKWRGQLIPKASGRVLEIGVGTGKNLPYYSADVELTAIDISENMLKRAIKKAKKLGRIVDFRFMDAQHLDFQDELFDTVVATYVFCSVPDPVQGLREIKRVLKKGGKLLLLEHVRKEERLAGFFMDVLNPLFVRLTGANINRRTVENVKKAGLKVSEVAGSLANVFKRIEARKVS